MMSGLKKITDIKELEINKLFGRKSVLIEDKLLGKRVLKNNILITGAGGSIGSELCKISIKHNPRKLILLDISEFALHSIYLELNRIKENHKQIKTKLVPILGSINDKKLIENIFKKYQFESVYHAAAYKHVKLVEENKTSGIVNNVIGTKILVKVSIKYSSKNFVLVSSDKAVKPTNLMGATKRLAELIVKFYSKNQNQTCFSIVRFGNVLGSSGSVIPIFQKQISYGGPLTVTHPEATRFFMTISEAAQLVIQASSIANGGEVFILDMGEPIKIIDIAHRMIKMHGHNVKNKNNKDGIEIKITGLSSGEKLHEDLSLDNKFFETKHLKIKEVKEENIYIENLEKDILNLSNSITKNNIKNIILILKKLVPSYKIIEY